MRTLKHYFARIRNLLRRQYRCECRDCGEVLLHCRCQGGES